MILVVQALRVVETPASQLSCIGSHQCLFCVKRYYEGYSWSERNYERGIGS